MKYLILAAGYGTRLETDVRNDTSGKFKHLVGVPKPLVPLAGKPLTTYWIECLRACGVNLATDAFLVTNHVSYPLFAAWAATCAFPVDNVIDDGSTSNATRLGAIRDISMVIEKKQIHDDLCILGGDTLFFNTFSLTDVVSEFERRHVADGTQGVVLWYPCEDWETKSSGILMSGADSLVYGFVEKPQPQDCPSRQACPCFYIYAREVLPTLHQYVADNLSNLKSIDAPGTLVPFLCTRAKLLAYRIDGRFDIGGLNTFIEADAYFQQHIVNQDGCVLMGPKKMTTTHTVNNDNKPTADVPAAAAPSVPASLSVA